MTTTCTGLYLYLDECGNNVIIHAFYHFQYFSPVILNLNSPNLLPSDSLETVIYSMISWHPELHKFTYFRIFRNLLGWYHGALNFKLLWTSVCINWGEYDTHEGTRLSTPRQPPTACPAYTRAQGQDKQVRTWGNWFIVVCVVCVCVSCVTLSLAVCGVGVWCIGRRVMRG